MSGDVSPEGNSCTPRTSGTATSTFRARRRPAVPTSLTGQASVLLVSVHWWCGGRWGG